MTGIVLASLLIGFTVGELITGQPPQIYIDIAALILLAYTYLPDNAGESEDDQENGDKENEDKTKEEKEITTEEKPKEQETKKEEVKK